MEAVRLRAVRGQIEDAYARFDECGADPELVIENLSDLHAFERGQAALDQVRTVEISNAPRHWRSSDVLA